MWSESPIPRPGVRRVRTVGVAVNACGLDYPRSAFTSTYADFTVADGSFIFVALTIQVTYTLSATGDVGIRVTSITTDPGDPPSSDITPTDWETITGPGSGVITLADGGLTNIAAEGTLTGWRVEWDTPGAVSALCAVPIDNI